MSHQPQDVSLTLLKNGSMRTGTLHTMSVPFRTFVASVEPEYARHMNAYPGDRNRDDIDDEVREKAQAAHFTANKRNDRFHFGFGFSQNHTWTQSRLIYQFCGMGCGDRGFSVEEKIAYILEKHPSIQLSAPDIYDGEPTYTEGHFDRGKAGWDYHFGRTDVAVYKGPKPKAVAQ